MMRCRHASSGDVYLKTLPPLDDTVDIFRKLLGHQQVTDAYLLGVAESSGATLLTLDRRVVPPGTTRPFVEVVKP